MLNTRQNPQLGMEPLRELCLEPFDSFTSRMTAVMNKVHLALTNMVDDMAGFTTFTRRKPHCTKLET